MSETHSRAGKRVEQLSVTDEPHERYQKMDPWTNETLDNGIPILNTTDAGQVVDKEIIHYIVHCPECLIPAKYSHDSEPLCPNCGIVCSGKNAVSSPSLIRDAKAAGRVETTN